MLALTVAMYVRGAYGEFSITESMHKPENRQTHYLESLQVVGQVCEQACLLFWLERWLSFDWTVKASQALLVDVCSLQLI